MASLDHQGGKLFGKKKAEQEESLREINEEILNDEHAYKDVEDLAEKLEAYKKKFMEFDMDNSGGIDIMELKLMLEKLGNPKTHRELQKMIADIDSTKTGHIIYRDFLDMMLGSRSSILRRILMFEEKAKKNDDVPKGPSAKKGLQDLP